MPRDSTAADRGDGSESTVFACSLQASLVGLKARGLRGVEYVVSDHHEGLRRAIRETLPEAGWQRRYVHFLRNALDYAAAEEGRRLPGGMRWLYDRRDVEEARRDL
jgi:transposase-like protein